MEPENTEQADALKRALIAIRDLRGRLADAENRGREPVAIVGMACRFPGGATTPEAFWELLQTGTDATCEVPPDRWDANALYDADPAAPGRVYVRRGAFLREPVDCFDAGFFHISPREAAKLDPVHRLLLELTWESLEHAGISPHSLAGTDTGVFVGLSGSDYAIMEAKAQSSLTAIDNYRGLGTAACVGGGRISHLLGVRGPNIVLDTACSSGLVALVQAVESLRTHRCGLALAGSGHLMLTPEGTVFLCRMQALSADGRCRTYDAAASGYGRGEGGAMFVLKRLRDAEADGDTVLAVIRGIACNHDGRSSGLTVPNPAAQQAVIASALRDADLQPAQIDYVETHGTATPLGDPVELRALAEVLGKTRASGDPLRLGSVKTNFGHLEAVAGLAGLMKVVLSLRHGAIPAHLHFKAPTPHVDWRRLPLRVVTELTDWPQGGEPRRAGVSAFGFSGTNAHVIVEEAPPASVKKIERQRPVELIALSGASSKAVRELAHKYRERMSSASRETLADLATSSTAGRAHLAYRTFALGEDAHGMALALREIETGGDELISNTGDAETAPLAFLFTGQGAQQPGMARELWETSPTFRRALEQCAEIVDPHLDAPLLPLLTDDVDPERLRQTAVAQPALFAFEYALTELWRSWGVEPAFVLGHSLGEYVAATVAGVMALEEALPLVALRGRLMQGLPPGGIMASAFTSEAQVRACLSGLTEIDVAAVNGPENVVISGRATAVEEALARLQAQGVAHRALEVSHAFHSPLMEPILDRFQEAVAALKLSPPRIPLVSNLTAQLLTDAESKDPVRWRRHIREPVRFAGSIKTLVDRGVGVFLEIGPRPTLCSMAQDVIREPRLLWLASARPQLPAWRQLLESVGELYRAGYELDWQGFSRDHAGRRTVGPTYPFQRKRYWFSDGHEAADAFTSTRSRAPSSGVVLHPLLGSAIESPAVEGWAFENVLEPQQPPYLSEHRVQGHVVVPAAAYVEMMLAAVREGPGWTRVSLNELTFEQPLVLAAGVTCQVLLSSVSERRLTARVVSASAARPRRWTTHATAVVATVLEGVQPAHDRLERLRSVIDTPADTAVLYEEIAKRGVIHGPAFRSLSACWTGEQGTLGRAELSGAATAELDRYILHPCALDAGFQLLASLVSGDLDPSATFVPAGIDRMHVGSSLGAGCWIHGKIRDQGAAADPDEIVADLTFFDEQGAEAAELTGFRLRRLRHTLAPARVGTVASDPVYTVQWVDSPIPQTPVGDLSGTWLVLEDERKGVGAALQAALAAHGGRSIRVRPGSAFEKIGSRQFVVAPASSEDWHRLLEACNVEDGSGILRGVIHCWALDDAPAGADDPLERILASVLPIAGLVRSGVLSTMPEGLRVVTCGAAGPQCGTASGWAQGAAAWGMLAVLQAEHPEISCRVLDLGMMTALEGEQLLSSLFAQTVEDRVALDHARSPRVPRLVRRATVDQSKLRAVPAGDAYRIDIERRGTLDALRYLAAARSDPAANEVEVRVRWAGLNFRDVLNVLGAYPGDPGLPGIEFAGTVVRVGANVSAFAPGDAVLGIGSGTFGSHVTVPEHAIARCPANLSLAEAASIPLAFLTAEYGLTSLAGLAPAERVLVHAAAGGVGQAAIQLAQALGAEVFATAGSEAKRDLLRAQGVQHVFSSRDTSFADEILRMTNGTGVDVVLNSLTGELLERSLGLLRSGGRFLELGKAEVFEADEVARRYPGVRYMAYDLASLLIDAPDAFQSMFRDVVSRFERGTLKPLHMRIFPAAEIVDAFRYMAQARHTGKILVKSGRVLCSEEAVVRSDGAYLVTGGTGGVGREVVEWLIAEKAGAVILNSRSHPDDEASAWLNEVRGQGVRVEWLRGDVAISADVQRIVKESQATGWPLRGVFHCAGVVDDGLIEGQSREQFTKVLAPKVAGAWNLHLATIDLDLDHFVLFSSVSSLIGGVGQANYAAANAFLDALACHRAASGCAAQSIAWGAWGSRGMAARLTEAERQMLERRGLGFLEPRRAIQLMHELLREGSANAVVAEIDWTSAAATVRKAPALLQELLLRKDKHDSIAAVGETGRIMRAADLQSLEPQKRLEQIERYLRSALGKVLDLPADELAANVELVQTGFDSMMAVELRNRIETELGILVPASRLLATATLSGLVNEIDGMITATELPAAEHEERQALVEGEI